MDLEAQIINRLTLPHIPIHNSLQIQLRRIGHDLGAHDLRSNRCIRVEAFGEVPLRDCTCELGVALELPRADVVAAEVPAYVVVGVGLGDVERVLGDDEAEFAFVVGLVVLREFGDDDWGVVVVEAGVCFDEGGWVRRKSTAAFLNCMISLSKRTAVRAGTCVLCLMKLSPIQRMMGTSAAVTGPRSFLTVTSWSVTFVAGSKMSLLATSITLAFRPVSSVVVPTSKSGEGRIGSPRRVLPSVDSKRMRRFQAGILSSVV